MIPVAFMLLSMISACSPRSDDAAPGHTFKVYTEDGLAVAHSSEVPKFESELFRYERWFVLQEDEGGESTLAGPEPGVLDERGFLYVPDSSPSDQPSVSRIAVFDSAGVFRYAFGRPGHGPGDLWHPVINRVGGGILETCDLPGQLRLTRYRTDGSLVDLTTLPGAAGMFRAIRCCGTGDDRFLLLSSRRSYEGDRQISQARATVLDAGADSLWSAETEEVPGMRKIELVHRGRINLIFRTMPFAPAPGFAYHPELGILLTSGREPVLDIYDVNGRHKLQIRIDLPYRPVTPADRESFEAYLRARPAFEDIQRELYEAELEHVEYPEYKAFWGESFWGEVPSGAIEVDEGGYIWIRVPVFTAPHGAGVEALSYRVLSRAGEYIGLTRLPDGSRRGRTRITRGCLVVVEEDRETGREIVVVYRIRPAAPGLRYP